LSANATRSSRDSTFPYGPCPRCGRHSNFTAIDAPPLTFAEGEAVLDRHVSPTVRAELRQFLISRGYHPPTGVGWFLDSLGFAALGGSARP